MIFIWWSNVYIKLLYNFYIYHYLCVSDQIRSDQSLIRVRLFATPWIAACQASLSITTPGAHSDSRLSSQWCHPAISSSIIPFSSFPQSLPASGSFQWVNSSHQVAKVLEFQLQHQSSNEHPGLISFRMDWLDFLAVPGTLKSLLQHHSSKDSILRDSYIFWILTPWFLFQSLLFHPLPWRKGPCLSLHCLLQRLKF